MQAVALHYWENEVASIQTVLWFHPDATDAFRAAVHADLADAGFKVAVRNAESPPKG